MKISADSSRIFACFRLLLPCAPLLLAFSLLLPAIPAMAASTTAPPSAAGSGQQDGTKQFNYVLQNRKDPFMPFITEKSVTKNVNMNEIVQPKQQLTGMQLFEPGQLTLVALIKSGSQQLAMVEDHTGKGYVITKGTKIGRFGVVKQILPNQVIIEETKVTRAGRKIVTHTAMVLKKEGEK